MARLAAFLPPHLVAALRALPPAPPEEQRFEAALLLSDISGFTALSERLQARGREGAEEVAEIVSAAFRPAIGAMERWGGSIVSFGGDALFAVFTGASPVRCAVRAAEEIRQSFRRRATGAREPPMAIAQAVHHGIVRALHLGSEERRHYVLVGDAVARLVRLEDGADPHEIRLSVAARAHRDAERPARQRARRRVPIASALVRTYLPPSLVPLLGRFEGEYRNVAVLFLEQRGSRLSATQRFAADLDRVLESYGGTLLKTDPSASGTRWLCVFGIPTSQEREEARAARVALDMRAGTGHALRGALHAGIVANVVVGAASRRSFDVMGDVVNTAARALAEADWGELLVTEESRRQCPGIATAWRGAHKVKGKSEALRLHALVGLSAATPTIAPHAPLVGRAGEMARLSRALDDASRSHGCAIAIQGDPGLGKSRLKWEVARLARERGLWIAEGQSPAFGGGPYGAVRDVVRQLLALAPADDPALVRQRIETECRRLSLGATDSRHLADLLGYREGGSPLAELDGATIRQNNMIAVRSLLRARAMSGGGLVVLEDAHWADELTHQTLDLLCRDLHGSALLLLVLYRPGFPCPSGAEEIVLREIGPEDVGQMLHALLGPHASSVTDLVCDRAEGNPFFVEELVQHLQEAGFLIRSQAGLVLARQPGPHDLPDSLRSVIAARLDRLSPAARRVAQLGAVLGRSFSLPLLRRLDGLTTVAAGAAAELEERRLVFRQGGDPASSAEYIFKHALTRDVAYGSILVRHRRRLHRMAALAIESLAGAADDRQQAALAHHWQEAGDLRRARELYLRSARQASAAFANEEAERLFRAYLDLVTRPRRESIAARIDLGQVLSRRGLTAAATAEHERALAEARRLRDRKLEAENIRALGNLMRVCGHGAEARQLLEAAKAKYRIARDHERAALVTLDLANLCESLGRLDESASMYGDALALFRRTGDRKSEGLGLGNLAAVRVAQGRWGEAQRLYDEALAIHREMGDRRNLGVTLGNMAVMYQSMGRIREARTLYEQGVAIAREVGDRRLEGVSLHNLGRIHHEADDNVAARDCYERGLQMVREVGDRRLEGIALAALATIEEKEDAFDEAERRYEESLALLKEVGDRRWEGIVAGYLATLESARGRPERARSLFQKAFDLARQAGDKLSLATFLISKAKFERRQGRDPADCEALLAEAQPLLEAVGAQRELGLLLCEYGHLDLSRGASAAGRLQRAQELATRLGSELGQLEQALPRLASAQRAFEAGAQLRFGERHEDAPE